MRDGFTFCDVDIADIGLHYAPELENTYVYSPAHGDTHIESFEGHDGGYYYGSWAEPKEFILRCYFEDTRIDKGIMSKVHNLFKRGRTGKLVFQKRPWCYYYATVTDVDDKTLYNYMNGCITISMTAVYPFARSDIIYSGRTDKYHANLMVNSAVYESSSMVPATSFTNLTSTKTFVLGNPGTEYAPLGVYIDGDAISGVIIKNLTLNQEMKIVNLTKALTTNVSKRLYVDSLNGKTMLVSNAASQMAFMYHDHGFLGLEPCYPADRNIHISYTSGTTTITSLSEFPTDCVGKYIFASNKWVKINNMPDRNTITVSSSLSSTKTERTQIMPMNEFSITPVDTMSINISFAFKPTYT